MRRHGPTNGRGRARTLLSHAFTSGARESGGRLDDTEPPQPRATSRTRANTHPITDSEPEESDLLHEAVGASYVHRAPILRANEYDLRTNRDGAAAHRMSANPTRDIEEHLRSFSVLSGGLYGSPAGTRNRSESGEDEQEMDDRRPNVAASRGSRDKMDAALPESDGMHDLRLRLHEIRELAISTEEKARRMHQLMTQDYLGRHAGGSSPISLGGGDAKSLQDEPAALDVGVAAVPIDPSNPYNIRPGDLEQTFSPLPNVSQIEDNDESMEEEEEETFPLGCVHYKRNVKVQCFDCHRWFPCRNCHDQAQDLPFPHTLRRKMTRNMLCMLCLTPQPAAEVCMNCGEYAAWYYCPTCKLWDNDSNKRIYHCDDCGICRIGEGLGKDFVHCKKCNVCISIARYAAHTCVENATKGPCPLCLDEMFSSQLKVVSLPCGHYMHGDCYKDLMAVTYKCPVCSRSAVNMELQWRKLDDEIRAQPMPDDDEELSGLLPHLDVQEAGHERTDEESRISQGQPRRPRLVWIGCNDCNNRCQTPFHWLGLKCQHCDSYNTNQMAPTAGHVESEAERLLRQQQQVVSQRQEITGNAVLRDAGIGADENQQGRVDSAHDAPSSPTSLLAVPASPTSPGSPSSGGLPSPRRYFVQEEEPRRPSFTAPYFSTPTLPTLANLPNLPEMPRLPRMPTNYLPNMPNMPDYLAHMPNMPNLPNMANLPHMPEFGKFSPYQMFDSLSRSLSPMRYYLQGLDRAEGRGDGGQPGEGGQRGRERRSSRLSVRSDPLADATIGRTGGQGWFWGGDDRSEDGNDDDEGDEELDPSSGGPHVLSNQEAGDSSSESGSEVSDAEMLDDEDDLDAGTDVDEMELFGHR